jgi:ferredoxin
MDNNPQTPTVNPQGEGDKEVLIGKYKVKVIRSACIGAASCVAVSTPTFKLDGENKAIILEDSQDTAENILMAAQSCPTKAIIVIDTETNTQVWPA